MILSYVRSTVTPTIVSMDRNVKCFQADYDYELVVSVYRTKKKNCCRTDIRLSNKDIC